MQSEAHVRSISGSSIGPATKDAAIAELRALPDAAGTACLRLGTARCGRTAPVFGDAVLGNLAKRARSLPLKWDERVETGTGSVYETILDAVVHYHGPGLSN